MQEKTLELRKIKKRLVSVESGDGMKWRNSLFEPAADETVLALTKLSSSSSPIKPSLSNKVSTD